MIKIVKYALEQGPYQEVVMPKGANIISHGVQENEPFIWVEVDPNKVHVDRKFRIFITGDNIYETPLKYIGTFLLDYGHSVLHLYEELV